MFTLVAALLALSVQDGGFTEDPDALSDYMMQSCLYQQSTQQGGEQEAYIPFCTCLDQELAANTSSTVYRALALGSQGAIGENAEVDDPAGALAEAERLMTTVNPEEAGAVQATLQGGLFACLSEMPDQAATE